jgi:hypothetical protein
MWGMSLTDRDRRSLPRQGFHPCGRQGKFPLYLATVETIVEVNVVPAANPQITGHVIIEMMARKVHAAHVRTMGENAREARS